MEKFKRIWKILLIIFVLMIGIVMIIFIKNMMTGNFFNNVSQQTELLENTVTGKIKMINQDSLTVEKVDGEQKLYKIDNDTIFLVRDPKLSVYVDYLKENIVPGVAVVLELDKDQKDVVATLKAEQTTVLGGLVKEVNGQNIKIEDNMNISREILISDSTIIYLSGGEDRKLEDIIAGKSIIIYSARSLEDGVVLEAGWVEIIDESKYISN